jgi:hypothetical protein
MGRSSHLSFARAVPIALLLALAAPAVARADATVSVTGTAPNKTLTYTVDDALDHMMGVWVASGDIVINDVDVSVGVSGCATVDRWITRCGPATDFERVVLVFGKGNDSLAVPWYTPVAVSADGGAGDDVLHGGALNDQIVGGEGADELYGAGGDDQLSGGIGDDYLVGDVGADTFDGGEGDDELQTAESLAAADAAVACGDGDDVIVGYDDGDPIDTDCETVDPPYLDGDLWITGQAREGNVLGLSLPTNIGGDGQATVQWERCDASGYDCTEIDGAQAATYTLTAADVGLRLRAWYAVENGLGDDWVESGPTNIVLPAYVTPPTPRPPTTRPPRPTIPRPPRPSVTVPNFVIPPLMTVRKPYFALPNGDPIVDTGRTVLCPGAPGGVPCRLKVTARPSGASARWRRRPASAGETSVLLAAGRPGRVRVPLNLRAYRLLRAHHKLTLSVTATITRPHSKLMRSTFTITVRTPAHKRR